MTWLTYDAHKADDRFDPDDSPWRYCSLHRRQYAGKRCSTCVLADMVCAACGLEDRPVNNGDNRSGCCGAEVVTLGEFEEQERRARSAA